MNQALARRFLAFTSFGINLVDISAQTRRPERAGDGETESEAR